MGSGVVCFILAELFDVPSLVQACLEAITPLMTLEVAHVLLVYAEAVNSHTLKQFSSHFLTNNSSSNTTT